MIKYLLTLAMSFWALLAPAQEAKDLQGAWQTEGATLTLVDGFFSYAAFDADQASFQGTKGGAWSLANGKINLKYEYHTWDSSRVGTPESLAIRLEDGRLMLGEQTFTRMDNGTPGLLNGAWLISGRMQDGKMSEMTPGPRKTLKILSGTRFQWIAYHTGTKQFMGTGGGTYTTQAGKYVENIEFFSRDSSRVGASLSFDYERKDGKWHHQGKSSKGDPIYEVWSERKD
ncbi:MAG: membrane or secreted protein [Bacteroidia bacterium]|nr:membrane or secreted protein [Bacteroidia bacterium]